MKTQLGILIILLSIMCASVGLAAESPEDIVLEYFEYLSTHEWEKAANLFEPDTLVLIKELFSTALANEDGALFMQVVFSTARHTGF